MLTWVKSPGSFLEEDSVNTISHTLDRVLSEILVYFKYSYDSFSGCYCVNKLENLQFSQMDALPTVEAFVSEKLAALGIDADSYANYVASVLADVSQPQDERRATLQEMLVLTVDSSDISAGVETFLTDAFAFQESEDSRLKAEKEAAAAAAAAEAAARAASGAIRAAEEESDDAVKRAIVMQYGYIDEEDEEDGSGAKGGKDGKKKKGAAAAPEEPSRRSNALDAALEEIEEATAGKSVTAGAGLGRRAKRAAAAVEEVERAAQRERERELLTKSAMASAGNLHARAALGSAAAAEPAVLAAALAAKGSSLTGGRDALRERDAATADMLGKMTLSPPDDDSDAEGAAATAAGKASRVVVFDPLADFGRIDNRAAAKERDRAVRDDASSKHADDVRKQKEAAEAAR